MQILEEQQRNKGCPNLNTKGIFARADKGFYLQVLLKGLEEYFNLPSVFVDCGNCCCAKGKVVGQEDYFTLIYLVPDDNTSK